MTGFAQAPALPDLGNVQGLIAYRYRQPHYAVLLYRITEPLRVRAFIRDRRASVPRGDRDPTALVGPVLNFAFTWAGLRMLLAGDPNLDLDTGQTQLDFAFTDQTPEHAAVSGQLGFVQASSPVNWWDGHFTNNDIHMALYVALDDRQPESSLAEVRASARQSGLTELPAAAFPGGALRGSTPQGGILHFGYRDGVTSPVVDWKDERLPGKVNFREFVMGYPSGDDYPVAPISPGPWQDFARDGAFACLAWIEQDVAAFNRFLDTGAALVAGEVAPGLEREWLAAKLMGRWRDGSPLVRHPHAAPATPDYADGFGYRDDPDGMRCPLTAHIRVANARDQELTFANQRRFPSGPPRLIRRGFSYGPTLTGPDDDGVGRGVIGTFICARINEQFYTVLRWMQKTDFCEDHFRKPNTGTMQDALMGNRGKPGADATFPMPLAGDRNRSTRLADFIKYKGVAAFFLPSLKSLDRLSR